MPRNSSGVYTLPSGNPVITGTTITSTWANTLASDIATELTNSLDRSGRGSMSAPFRSTDGTPGAPGLTFGNEPTLGFYRPTTSQIGVSILGTQVGLFTTGGLTATLTGNVTGNVTGSVTGNVTGSVTGNAGSATVLQTARTFTVGNTGKSFNGGADVGWSLAEIGAYAATNPSGFQTASNVAAATVANSNALNGQAAAFYTDIPARLGFTPYNATNPSGFQTASQVAAAVSGGVAGYLPLTGGTLTGNLNLQRTSVGTVVSLRGGSGAAQGAALYVTRPDSATTMTSFGDLATSIGGTPGITAGVYTDGSIPFAFYLSGAERMRIDANGNVLVGKTATSSDGRFQSLGSVPYDGNFQATASFKNSDLASGKGIILGHSSVDNSGIIAPTFASGSGSLAFWTQNGVTWGERMRLLSSGTLVVGGTVSNYDFGSRGVVQVTGAGSAIYGLTIGAVGQGYLLATGSDVRVVASGATNTLQLGTNDISRFTMSVAGDCTFTNSVTAPSFLGSGAALTALNAGNLGSGTVPAARIGSGTDYAVGDGSTVGGLAVGYRNIPRGANTTIDTTKRGRVVVLTAGATIPAAVFSADDTIALYNNSAAAITITQGASLTMYGPNAVTGNRTLAARGWATIWFNAGNECKITGEVT